MGCFKLSERGQGLILKELKEQLNPEMVNDVRDGDNRLNPANKVYFCLYYTETGQRVGKSFLFLPENQSQLTTGYDYFPKCLTVLLINHRCSQANFSVLSDEQKGV